MTARYSVVIGMTAVLVVGAAHAYEVETHKNLTRHAYDQSILANPTLSPLLVFGVEDQGEPRFISRAIEDTYPYEDLESIHATAREVVAIGAHQEDIPVWPITQGRFLNHFYDPQRGGVGLDVPGFSGLPSPNWVLEDQGDVPAQQESLRDALEFHRQALTLPQQAERDVNLARLLEIIGRSVHHLQDMSQPAHVRSDAHPPPDFDIYESYTDRNFGLGNGHRIPSASPYPSGAVDLDTFDTARKFWSNSGRGIAEFTSSNFVSKDTNFRGLLSGGFDTDPNHSLPTIAGTQRVTLGELGLGGVFTPSFAAINFFHTQVQDAYLGTFWINDRASTFSLFDPDLTSASLQPRMTLNRFNFQKNYEILLPRAIAYSAGLINYYFRGRFELEDFTRAGGVSTVTVRNVSAPDFAMGSGLQGFRLFYDAVDGQRREILDVEELDNPGVELEFDQTRRLRFTTPADVDLSKQNQYLLMFDGTIGTETGVAALAFGEAGTGLRVTPNYLPTDSIAGPRQLTWNSSAWTAAPAQQSVAGEIDWKGHKPEDVLTWGAGRRYHSGAGGGGPLYMNGRILTWGPTSGWPIIGASIRYINEQRVLNVATESAGFIRIYSRTFAERYENEDLWSDVNPLGWRLVYSGEHGRTYTGFFFNASGDEGQYLTRHPDNSAPYRRVKVNLSGFTGAVVEFPAVATVTRTERMQMSTQETFDIQAGVCLVSPGYPYGAMQSGGEGCGVEYSGTENRVNHYTVTEQYADHTLFCVDYRGDQEVFCELLPPPSPIVQSSLDQTLIDQHLRYATNPWCPLPNLNETQFSRTITQENNPTRIMKIGNLEIPWTAESRTLSNNESWGGPSYAGNDSNHLTMTDRTTKLIQFDARHDFAVYEERLYESVNDFTSSYSDPGSLSFNESQSYVRSERVIVQLGGQRQVLFDETESDATETPGTGISPNLPYDGLRDCVPVPASDQSTTTSALDPAAASNIFSNMSFYSSYAIDRAGRLGLSQRITEFEYPYQSRGYQNVLTDGDLPALIPGTPPTAGYSYDIRLIR